MTKSSPAFHDGVKKFSRQGKAKTSEWAEFARHISYQQGDFKKLQTYADLGEQCAKLEKELGAKVHRVFYMATPPTMFGEIPNTSARPDWRGTGNGLGLWSRNRLAMTWNPPAT